MIEQEWIGVDLDGTLAYYDTWVAVDVIGEPIPLMQDQVKLWLSEGKKVKVFTARVSLELTKCKVTGRVWKREEIAKVIGDWTEKHLGERLEVTAIKDYLMVTLYDDRARGVEKNTGKIFFHPGDDQ